MAAPMAKKDRPLVLWPLYFDARRSREDGRRVPRRLAIDAPTVDEIAAAVKGLGLTPTVEKEAMHPSAQGRKDGRVLLKANYVKGSVVAKVAEKIKAQRS